MLQNFLSLRNIRSFRGSVALSNGLEGSKQAATAALTSAVQSSSGMSANILDFLIPQKHVLRDVLAMETTGKAGVGEVWVHQASRVAEPGQRKGRAGSDSGKQGNEFEIRNPACG
jgi:hypothetical protein